MEHENSRTRRTKAAMRTSLAALILEKGVSNVTVRELTARTGINRATFYIHYHDISDMLGKIYSELLSDFLAVIKLHENPENIRRPYPIFLDIFLFLQKHSSICTALLSEHGDPVFIEQLKAPIREKCIHDWNIICPEEASSNRAAFFSHYAVSGFVGLVEEWLKNGMKEPPEEMAALVDRIFRTGTKSMLMQ